MSLGRLLTPCECCGSVFCLAQSPKRCRHTGYPRTGEQVDVASINTPTIPLRRRGRPPKIQPQQGSPA